jgi:hypothetical protein
MKEMCLFNAVLTVVSSTGPDFRSEGVRIESQSVQT